MQALRASQTLRASRPAVACRAAAAKPVVAQQQQPRQQQQQQERPAWQSAIGAAALSVALALSSPVMPAAQAASPQGLADLVRADYGFIDTDGDGVISRDDLKAFNAALSADEGLPAIGDGQLDFSLRLFDLNQDGTLTQEEILRSLALDGAVDDEAVDSGVFKVFDRNGNGKVDAGEWQQGLGDLGDNGDNVKRYIFNRVDRLTESKGELDTSDFGTALVLARTIILGY